MAGAPVPVPVPVPAPGLSVVDVVVTTGLAAPLAPGTADAPAAGDGVTTAPACAPEDPEEQADISAVNAVNATGGPEPPTAGTIRHNGTRTGGART